MAGQIRCTTTCGQGRLVVQHVCNGSSPFDEGERLSGVQFMEIVRLDIQVASCRCHVRVSKYDDRPVTVANFQGRVVPQALWNMQAGINVNNAGRNSLQ